MGQARHPFGETQKMGRICAMRVVLDGRNTVFVVSDVGIFRRRKRK